MQQTDKRQKWDPLDHSRGTDEEVDRTFRTVEISAKSDHPQNYDIVAIFKMAAVNHVEFAFV